MKFLRIGAISLLLLGNFTSLHARPATKAVAPHLNTATLFQRISALAARAKPGALGVAVMDLSGGPVWAFHGARRFPMQSVFKAPLAAAVLARVDHGTLSLNKTVVLRRGDLHGGLIADKFQGDQETFTVRALLKAAVIDSDNTAADALLRVIGGPRSVTSYLQAHGLREIRVDRSEQMLARTIAGVPSSISLSADDDDAVRAVPAETRRRALTAYLRDPRDTATPIGAVQFLVALKRGKLLSPKSTAMLLQDMEDVRTGLKRLKAGLPAGARLAHKTGTSGIFEGLSAATNDIGLITLPNGQTLAVAVFLMASPAPEAQREAVLADVARAAVAAAR
ncbi:MAG: class A beta-lactamase [Capsulimonas sp.]|uniref:class A beta-lactamase n=1 Tax=Capsulimonas sp. TaxID=2494211 RepID=UPI003266267C